MRPTLILIALIVVAGCGDREPTTRLSPAARNRLLGDRFLAENARKPGVVATASGLQYRILTAGEGPTPKLSDTVTFHYVGTFIDGREFQTSRDRGEEPVRIPLRNLIRGWQEGIQLMRAKSVYEFYIPGHLAYGIEGQDPIGPNQCLIFKVELLSFN